MPVKKEVSLDEVLESRKDFSDGDGGIYKAHISPRSWNDEERSAVFIMSAETEDRYRDVVVQAGIDSSHFEKNPVALFGHRSWDMPIGTWSDLRMVKASPRRTEGKLTFTEAGVDEMADRTAKNVKVGVLKACSIGFRPRMVEKILDDEGNWTWGYKFNDTELFECSVVTIPAVREALIKGTANGDKASDIIDPVMIEDFLETVRANPAVSKMVDRELYESVLREVTGNKTFGNVGTISVNAERPEWLDELKDVADRIERATGGSSSDQEEESEDQIDPIQKETFDAVERALSEVEPKLEELGDEDEERKSALSGLFSRVRSIFTTEKNEEEQKPVLASEEQKAALKARLEALNLDKTAA